MEDLKNRSLIINSDDDGELSNDGAEEIPVVKKRGRPANPNKMAVKKPTSGRGRGRPPKNPSGAVAVKRPVVLGSDEDEALANGARVQVAHVGRGRPPKQGKKSRNIQYTGKGRGRPKNPPKSDHVAAADAEADADADADDDDEVDDDDGESSDYKPGAAAKNSPKKVKRLSVKAKTPKKSPGRPRKVVNSDSDASDDDKPQDEERRSLGRPSTGAVNLNISRTGRGQGRPKAIVAKRPNQDSNGGVLKKRGRPSTGKVVPYLATGKPRGRPKAAAVDNFLGETDDDDNDDEKEKFDDDEEFVSGSNNEEDIDDELAVN